jgi:hypothetical protein
VMVMSEELHSPLVGYRPTSVPRSELPVGAAEVLCEHSGWSGPRATGGIGHEFGQSRGSVERGRG